MSPLDPIDDVGAAACRGLLAELARLRDIARELRAVGGPSARLAERAADPSWIAQLLGIHRDLEGLRRLLERVCTKAELGEYYDVEALRAEIAQQLAARPPEQQIEQLLLELDRSRRVERTLVPLFSCHVAGTTFRSLERVEHADGTVAVLAAEDELVLGEVLSFDREPRNRHDATAIRVLGSSGRWLGYVPREQNEVIARLLDAGKEIVGIVETVERHERGWLEIQIEVCFADYAPAAG